MPSHQKRKISELEQMREISGPCKSIHYPPMDSRDARAVARRRTGSKILHCYTVIITATHAGLAAQVSGRDATDPHTASLNPFLEFLSLPVVQSRRVCRLPHRPRVAAASTVASRTRAQGGGRWQGATDSLMESPAREPAARWMQHCLRTQGPRCLTGLLRLPD